MSLRRSSGSLGSLCLFYKADVVVFCEGGESIDVARALSFSATEPSLDAIYWSNIASLGGSAKKFHFKSVGCKDTLIKIASDVLTDKIDTVTICMDSDYDGTLDRRISGERVAYTHGYSWESDVLSRETISELVGIFVGPHRDDINGDLELVIAEFEIQMIKWCEIDIALKSASEKCVFDRKKPFSSVCLTDGVFSPNEELLSRRLGELGYVRGPKRKITVTKENVLQTAFGKMVSKYLYHTIVSFVRKIFPKFRIDYDNFMRIAIRETFSLINSGGLIYLREHISGYSRAFR